MELLPVLFPGGQQGFLFLPLSFDLHRSSPVAADTHMFTLHLRTGKEIVLVSARSAAEPGKRASWVSRVQKHRITLRTGPKGVHRGTQLEFTCNLMLLFVVKVLELGSLPGARRELRTGHVKVPRMSKFLLSLYSSYSCTQQFSFYSTFDTESGADSGKIPSSDFGGSWCTFTYPCCILVEYLSEMATDTILPYVQKGQLIEVIQNQADSKNEVFFLFRLRLLVVSLPIVPLCGSEHTRHSLNTK